MRTWHERLEEALAARGEKWESLVRITDCSKPSVYAWKPGANKRSTMMNGDNAARVCHALGISPLWLFFGEGPSGLERALEIRASETDEAHSYFAAAKAAQDPTEQLLISAYRRGDETARHLLKAQAEAIIANLEKGAVNGL